MGTLPAAPEVDSTEEPAEPQDTFRFGIITMTFNNAFYAQIRDSANAYAEELGNVEVTVLGPSNLEEQLKAVEDYAATDPDAIAVAAYDATAIIPVIDSVRERGIPVFCIDNNCTGTEKESYIGTDNFLGAQVLGQYIIDRMGGEGKMAIVEGPAGNFNSMIRLSGLEETFNNVDHNIEIVASLSANWLRDEAMTVTTDIITAHPDVELILCLNDEMASGAMEAIHATGRTDIVLIGYNGVPEAIRNVYDGGFQATVVQYPELMATTFIDMAIDLVQNGTVPEQEVSLPATVVDTELMRDVVDNDLAATDDLEEVLYAKLRNFYNFAG